MISHIMIMVLPSKSKESNTKNLASSFKEAIPIILSNCYFTIKIYTMKINIWVPLRSPRPPCKVTLQLYFISERVGDNCYLATVFSSQIFSDANAAAFSWVVKPFDATKKPTASRKMARQSPWRHSVLPTSLVLLLLLLFQCNSLYYTNRFRRHIRAMFFMLVWLEISTLLTI